MLFNLIKMKFKFHWNEPVTPPLEAREIVGLGGKMFNVTIQERKL